MKIAILDVDSKIPNLALMKISSYGADPFVMPYDRSDRYQRRFARWVNHKATFNSVAWADYED